MTMKQYLIITLAAVFFTACGQKKESAQQAAEVQKQETPAPTVSAEEQAKIDAEKARVQAEAEKIEAEKKAKAGRGTIDKKRVAQKTPKGKKGHGGGKKSGAKGTEQLVSTQELQLTGGTSKLGYVYTGSAQDSIINVLAADEQGKAPDEFKRNAAVAASIWDMGYLIDSTGLLWIEIKLVKSSGGFSKVQVKTPYKVGQVMHVAANAGSSSLDISAECLDSDMKSNQCSNLLVTFVQDGGQATAMLRQSLANIWFEAKESKSAADYSHFVEFFNNASLDVETPNKLHKAYLYTFEVVNGKSGFKAVVTGKQNQVIALKADLLLQGDLSAPMTSVDKETKFNEVEMWMGRNISKDLGLSNLVNEAVLVQNSTKGELTFDLKVGAANKDFKVKFSRVPVSAEL